MKISASQKENASKYTAGRDDVQQAVVTNTCCPVSPERIRSYYDGPTSSVRSSRQYPNFSVPTCVKTARIQNTKYPTTPFNLPRQLSFDNEHTNVSYNKSKQSPSYNALASKNWTVFTTTWSNYQSTPAGSRHIVEIDKHEIYPLYTTYPQSDSCVYAVSDKKRRILDESG